MDEITNTVTMRLEDFLEMRDDSENFYTLLDAIFEQSDLAYFDSELRYSTDGITSALKFVAPQRYKERVNALKSLKESKKED